MKLDSKIFDRIRVKPDQDRLNEATHPQCSWDGCCRPGTHRAPMGRDHEGQYFHFCIDHVRDYNKSYNYFLGMDDEKIRAWQKDSLTGHRPTWKMGVNGKASQAAGASRAGAYTRHNPFAYGNWDTNFTEPRRPKLKALEARAFQTLGLSENTRGQPIKSRYKELVKLHHPDANGGDRSSEERLRQIIQAYTLLKKAGFC